MVATRRGVRVYSPSKTNPERSSDVQATPSTGRRTRSTAKQAESATQNALVETCSQLEKSEGKHLASTPTCLMKRCTRASRLHSPEQPCTPVGSTHEGDISDMESCCSVVSDIEPPVTRTRARRRQPRTVSQEDEISEVESCSSAVSASRAGRSSRRNTRRKIIPESSDPASVEAEDAKVDLVLEAESCSSVVSESKRVTRSQRKTARTRSSAKQQIEDSELSDTDSYLSSVSGADVSESTSRRVARSRRQTGPIPIHLDEASESSLSPAPTRRSTRAAKGKTAATIDVCEAQSCDSEGFESGPTYSKTNRRQEMAKPGPGLGSDSELTDMHSPVGSPRSTRSRGTPCSSRTGSGSSRQGAPATRHSVKALSVALKEGVEDISFNDSRLESTVIAEDADQTLLEEKKEIDGVKSADPTSNEADALKVEKGVSVVLEEDSHVSDSPKEAVSKPAVTASYQQEELCDENKAGDTSEMEVMQETVPSSEQLNLCQSVTAALCERTSETTEETEAKDEAMEAVDVDAHPSQEEEAVDEGAVEKTSSSEEEKMEVSTLNSDAEQVVDSSEVHVESIQVTSSQQHNITVDSGPEQQPKDVTVQNKTFISLLESSEDEEDEEEEEKEVSEEEGEEDLGCVAEERGGPSNTSEAAGSSADGLFMIDKRPGQEADEYYYMEKPKEEEEEEEEKATKDEEESAEQEEQDEFVDEEGDDDDEEANILFLSKNPQLKEMSSRIDPGIRLKELGGLYINFDGSKSKPVSSSLQKLKEKKIQEEVMKKSVIGPDFAKKDAVPPYSESKQALKLKHRVEREKSTGDGWFNMKAPEISQELKGDLQVLKMRGSLDPKRFYKKNDRDGFPKYFQVGTVVDNPVDFYHSRVPKKDRKRTMVEELLADAEFRHNNKKKYQQIVAEKAAQGAGRRNKKKNKFHKK